MENVGIPIGINLLTVKNVQYRVYFCYEDLKKNLVRSFILCRDGHRLTAFTAHADKTLIDF